MKAQLSEVRQAVLSFIDFVAVEKRLARAWAHADVKLTASRY